MRTFMCRSLSLLFIFLGTAAISMTSCRDTSLETDTQLQMELYRIQNTERELSELFDNVVVSHEPDDTVNTQVALESDHAPVKNTGKKTNTTSEGDSKSNKTEKNNDVKQPSEEDTPVTINGTISADTSAYTPSEDNNVSASDATEIPIIPEENTSSDVVNTTETDNDPDFLSPEISDTSVQESITDQTIPPVPVAPESGVSADQSVSSDPLDASASDENEIIYVLNKNSKKFHFDYCTSVSTMAEHNKIISYNRDDVIAQGYKPCKRCNP